MARELIQYVEFTDDMDKHSPADVRGIVMAWKGKAIVLDLTQGNYDQLEAMMDPIAEAAHQSVNLPKEIMELGRDPLSPARKAKTNKSDQLAIEGPSERGRRGGETARSLAVPDPAVRKDIRQWALRSGFPVKARGILPNDVTEAYLKAHGLSMAEIQGVNAETTPEAASA